MDTYLPCTSFHDSCFEVAYLKAINVGIYGIKASFLTHFLPQLLFKPREVFEQL